jgi:hypothetical protein
MNGSYQSLQYAGDVLFLMVGAVLVFAMHAGFAFLEVGTVRKKNQVNALVKIMSDWGMSTVMYFVIGFPIAYGINFFMDAQNILQLTGGKLTAGGRGFDLVHFFFLLTFAACIPAIISGGVAERMKFWPQVFAGAIFTAVGYPLFESIIWGKKPFSSKLARVIVWRTVPRLCRVGGRAFRWGMDRPSRHYSSRPANRKMGQWEKHRDSCFKHPLSLPRFLDSCRGMVRV